jgi:hypothetical protein
LISVVIPCRTTPQTAEHVDEQLWYTASAAISSLEASKIDYEIVAVMNGPYPITSPAFPQQKNMRVVYAGNHVESPQAARHMGTCETRGETIFFIDSHVLVPPGFFRTVLDEMDETGADFMGTGHRYLSGTHYGCRVAWDEYLWVNKVYNAPPLGPNVPWRAAIHPHGAFAVKRCSYNYAGGYWRALRGWGGEETQLCLKFWMLGLSCWATPRTYHWHWLPTGSRRGPEVFQEERFARNFMMIAAAYGGDDVVRRAYRSFQILYWRNEDRYPKMMNEVTSSLETTIERERIAERGKFSSTAELRRWFDETGVIN